MRGRPRIAIMAALLVAQCGGTAIAGPTTADSVRVSYDKFSGITAVRSLRIPLFRDTSAVEPLMLGMSLSFNNSGVEVVRPDLLTLEFHGESEELRLLRRVANLTLLVDGTRRMGPWSGRYMMVLVFTDSLRPALDRKVEAQFGYYQFLLTHPVTLGAMRPFIAFLDSIPANPRSTLQVRRKKP